MNDFLIESPIERLIRALRGCQSDETPPASPPCVQLGAPPGNPQLTAFDTHTSTTRDAPSKRVGGRPRKVAPWFAAVARTMADGTTLRLALIRNNVKLDRAEARRLYRRLAFRRLYRLERHLWPLEQSGRHSREELAAIRKKVETFYY